MKNYCYTESKPNHGINLAELFSLLDPGKLGSDYQAAVKSGNREQMIKEVSRYFRNRPDRKYCQKINRSGCTQTVADQAVSGKVEVVNIPWEFCNGKINWSFNPTLKKPPVNHEWIWQLNRMNFWLDMCVEYEKSHDEKYPAAFNQQLRDWIDTAGKVPEKNWNSPGSLWRTIEAGLRMMYSWSLSFEIFRKSMAFSDENLCLMLLSMYHHAQHLQNHHSTKNNWLLMEMSGLYTFAALFPEFFCSSGMKQFAAEVFSNAILEQILPDGMQYELSPDYHSVMTSCAFIFLRIAKEEGIANGLPREFTQKFETALESFLNMMTPALTAPRTNDCFTIPISHTLLEGFSFYPNRKDFLWAGTKRKEGNQPATEPSCSRFLEWSGFAVMRSGWENDALYCLFDVGPLGCGHMHQDKLNINLFKGADELIYDDGGGQYEISPHRFYGISAADHNTVLVDGLMQRRSQPVISEKPVVINWISNETFDYAKAEYDDEFGCQILNEKDYSTPTFRPAKHTREIRFYKPDFFCVYDTLSSLDGNSHDYELRFHLDTLKLDHVPEIPGSCLSDYGATYDILIVPLFPEEMNIRHLSGVNEPPMAGWYVGRNDKALHKSTTLTMTISKKKECHFATLLIPVRREEPLPEIKKNGTSLFSVNWKGKEYKVNLSNLTE